jgi:hypothetical protein
MLIGIIASIPFLGTAREAWQILGASGGGIIGLLLEYRYLHYVPVTQPLPRQVLKPAVGLTGLGLPLLTSTLIGSGLLLQTAAYAVAALWVTLGAPALFIRLGLAQRSLCLPGAAR